MYANCGPRKTRRSVEIISLAFKWFIVLRSAIKRAIKRTECLKMRFPRPKTRKNRTCTRLIKTVEVNDVLRLPYKVKGGNIF